MLFIHLPHKLQSRQLLHLHHCSVNTYLQLLCPLLFASQLSPSNCKKYSFCCHRGTSGRHRCFMCVSGKSVVLCAFLVSASPRFSPLFSRGKSVIVLKPTQSLTLSHGSSHISLTISIPTHFFSAASSSWCFYCLHHAGEGLWFN